jgi:uncharacterized protein (DUF305 family)
LIPDRLWRACVVIAARIGTFVLVGVAVAGCSHGVAPSTPAPQAAPAQGANAAGIAQARRDSAAHPYTAADVAFMQGMIEHHAQAIAMSKWAPAQGASPSVLTLAARIINAQRDEIALMSQWLRNRQLAVPVPDTLGVEPMQMGSGHAMAMMPGMLTADQMTQLHAARGEEFDRLFLQDMIQHHRGAVTMVHQLFDTYGAAEDPRVFKLASDANVDQTTEIARMQRMLLVTTLGVDPGGDPR